MIRYLLLGLFLLTAQLASAQFFREGYVRLKGGEEKSGLIGQVIEGTPDGVQYKTSEDAEQVLYYANEVEGFGLRSGAFYSSFKNPGHNADWDFVELLVQGELTLVKKNNMFFVMPKADGQLYRLSESRLEFRRTLDMLMLNCPFISARTLRVQLNNADLIEHITAYNECVSVRSPNYDGAPKAITFALLAGYNKSDAEFSDKLEPSSRFLASEKLIDRSYSQIGADVTVRFPRFSSFLGVYTGGYFNSNSYQAITSMQLQDGNTEVNQFSLSYKELRFPLGVEYSIPNKSSFSCFLRANATFAKIMSLRSDHVTQEIIYKNGDVVQQPARDVVAINKGPLFGVGIGGNYRIHKMKGVRLMVTYTVGSGNAEVKYSDGVSTSYGVFSSLDIMAGFFF